MGPEGKQIRPPMFIATITMAASAATPTSRHPLARGAKVGALLGWGFRKHVAYQGGGSPQPPASPPSLRVEQCLAYPPAYWGMSEQVERTACLATLYASIGGWGSGEITKFGGL